MPWLNHNQQAALPQESDALPVQDTLKQLQEHLQATQSGNEQAGIGGGAGQVPGWSKPHLLGSGQDGLLSLTPADQAWVSGTQTVLSAGTALNWMSQGHLVLAVAGGLVLYTQGSQAAANSPNQERGIALHAAQGKVSARAHKNLAKVAAKTRVQIASTQADVQVSAPNAHLLATAAGAYLKLEGGNIELGAPGRVEFKASQREWTGGQSISGEVPALPKSEWNNWLDLELRGWEGVAVPGVKYVVTFADGSKRSGRLDDNGYARLASVPPHGQHKVEYENEGQDPSPYTLEDLSDSIKKFLGV